MKPTTFQQSRELVNRRYFHQFQKHDYIIKTKEQIKDWVKDFEKLRYQILKSQDSNKYNYASERFNLYEQEEMTVVYWKGEIVAFSSLYNRDYYPKGLSRVLNRMWKAPKIRFLAFHYIIPFAMLSIQLSKALSLKKKAVFISLTGKRNWLKALTAYLKEKDEKWIYCDRQYKIAPGIDESCWQNVAYLPLKPGCDLSFLDFPSRKSLHLGSPYYMLFKPLRVGQYGLLRLYGKFLKLLRVLWYGSLRILWYGSLRLYGKLLRLLRVLWYGSLRLYGKLLRLLRVLWYGSLRLYGKLLRLLRMLWYGLGWFYGTVLLFLFHHSPPMKLYYFSEYQYHKRIKPLLNKKRSLK